MFRLFHLRARFVLLPLAALLAVIAVSLAAIVQHKAGAAEILASDCSRAVNGLQGDVALERKLREADIEIAFPQRDIHIRSGVLKVEQVPPSSA